MLIPEFDANGVLPAGVFDCTLAEVRERFGSFRETDRRPRLFARLEELLTAMTKSGLFESVLIDGSFVTATSAPDDIDLLAVLHPSHDFERELAMAEYTLVSRTMLRRRFGFDVILARRDSPLYDTYVEFFGRVRNAPGLRKGLVRLNL